MILHSIALCDMVRNRRALSKELPDQMAHSVKTGFYLVELNDLIVL